MPSYNYNNAAMYLNNVYHANNIEHASSVYGSDTCKPEMYYAINYISR